MFGDHFSEIPWLLYFDSDLSRFEGNNFAILLQESYTDTGTGWARLIRSHSSTKISFEFSGNTN